MSLLKIRYCESWQGEGWLYEGDRQQAVPSRGVGGGIGPTSHSLIMILRSTLLKGRYCERTVLYVVLYLIVRARNGDLREQQLRAQSFLAPLISDSFKPCFDRQQHACRPRRRLRETSLPAAGDGSLNGSPLRAPSYIIDCASRGTVECISKNNMFGKHAYLMLMHSNRAVRGYTYCMSHCLGSASW